jgi:hypothetical protein
LLLPTDVERVPAPPLARIANEFLPKPEPLAVVTNAANVNAHIGVFVDEAAVGMRPTSLPELRRVLSEVPFEPGMLGVAQATAKIAALSGRQDEQLRLSAELYSDDLHTRVERFFAAHPNAQLWSEQQIMIVGRLLVENAAAGSIDAGMTERDRRSVLVALIATGSLIEEAETTAASRARAVDDWLAFFIQNGAYNTKPAPLGEFARTDAILAGIAREPERTASDKYCPLDDWMVADYSFTIEEQMSLGFALAAMTDAWSEDYSAGEMPRVTRENFDDLLAKFGMIERREAAMDLFAASRDQLRGEFARGGHTLAHVVWETRPFMRHPFARLDDGGLLLLSPRAIQSWLTDGFHYRLLDSAQRRARGDRGKTSRRYTAYAGELLELYALRLAESVYGERPIGGGRVYGEQPYGRRGEAKTSDVAIDIGLDLVLIEVSASRLRADTMLLATPDHVKDDLKRMLVAKIVQLDGCLNALIAGRAQIPARAPEVDFTRVERIWPIVVSAGAITQNQILWEYVRRETHGRLDQAKVQPVTLLDLEDLEQLLGLVEAGYALPDLLAGKCAEPYRDRELAVWLNDAPGAPRERPRPALVECNFDAVTERAIKMIDFTKGREPDNDSSAV